MKGMLHVARDQATRKKLTSILKDPHQSVVSIKAPSKTVVSIKKQGQIYTGSMTVCLRHTHQQEEENSGGTTHIKSPMVVTEKPR